MNANDRFEMIAAAYYKATGRLAPGKSDPLALEEDEPRRHQSFNDFASGWQAAESRATPQDGPVVWVARDKGTGGSLWLFRGEAPERVVHADRVDYFPQEGDPAHRLGSWVDDWALCLAPGACQRFRLVPEGETNV